MAEEIPNESINKYDYLFMDWVDKYITEIEDQGCTRIAFISRGLFNMYTWKETPYDITLMDGRICSKGGGLSHSISIRK